jgi:hypothetical protein
VAVGAHHIAFGDLGKDFLPVPARELVRDLESLVSQMFELEDHRIRFATVGTRVTPKELDRVLGSGLGAESFSPSLGSDVLLPIG